jgi:hypothetical protein
MTAMRDEYFGSHECQRRQEAVTSSRNFAPGLTAFSAPRALSPFSWAWTKLGVFLHQIVGPILLAVLFYGCLAPIGFLMRLSGKDPLRLKYEPNAESYWIRRRPPGPAPQSFRNQY